MVTLSVGGTVSNATAVAATNSFSVFPELRNPFDFLLFECDLIGFRDGGIHHGNVGRSQIYFRRDHDSITGKIYAARGPNQTGWIFTPHPH